MADIELVIKIPEDEYKNILLTGKASFRAVNAIESGTPLPKGHGMLKEERNCKNCAHNGTDICKEYCNDHWMNCFELKLIPAEVLDKIRAEFISLYPKNYAGEPELGGSSCEFSLNKVLNVIDKYKSESEG